MSRIGKQPITIPEGVSVKLEGKTIKAEGPKGTLEQTLMAGFGLEQKDSQLSVIKEKSNPQTQEQYGLQRSLIANMIKGVSEGFSKQLEINGVGYRAQLKGETLVLSLGFSHPIEFTPPAGIELAVNQNIITISGYDKQLVGEVAAGIRVYRKPEPYKGKGISYVGEHIRRKAGKAAAAKGATE